MAQAKHVYTPPTPEQIAKANAHYDDVREQLAKVDAHMPSAHGVKPLFRMRLVSPEHTTLGYHLIDVIAVLPGVRERGSKHTFPTYVGLGLIDGKWETIVEISGLEGAEEFGEAYEVVL